MGDAVLLKPVEEGSRCVDHLRFLHDHHTLEVGVNPAGSQVGPNSNVGVITGAFLLVVDAAEPLVEEVVEALVDVVCLAHDDRVALNGRVADGSYCVDLERGEILCRQLNQCTYEGQYVIVSGNYVN